MNRRLEQLLTAVLSGLVVFGLWEYIEDVKLFLAVNAAIVIVLMVGLFTAHKLSYRLLDAVCIMFVVFGFTFMFIAPSHNEILRRVLLP